MVWTDLNGDTGRYTGELNNDQLPHGKGLMKYDFTGLIGEGEWVNGVLWQMQLAPGMQPNSSGMSIGSGGANGFASG